MSADMNRTLLVGRLTRDAELQYTNSGFPICKFSIASNRSVKKNEQWEDEANFFDCTLLGKRGESLNQYLVKGGQIAIEGELKQERWEQDGQKRSKVVIIVTKIQLLSRANAESGNTSQSQNQSGGNFRSQEDFSQYTPPTEVGGGSNDKFQDDIPF